MKLRILVAAFFLLSSVGFAGTVTYDNSSLVNSSISPFGSPADESTSTYGETFAAPGGTSTVLNNFSLFLDPGPISGQLEGYIGTWTGSQAGSLLYTSAPVTVTGNFQQFTFNTGGLSLTPGAEYIAFLSISGPGYAGFQGNTSMPTVSGGGTIPGGTMVWFNNGADASLLTNTTWDGYNAFGMSLDAQFVADFNTSGASATPEPGSLVLFGSGIVGLIGMARRKFNL
jgi:hypothetical protein